MGSLSGLEGDSEYEKNKKYLKNKGGSLVVFEIKGGAEAGKAFIDSLKMISHVANVGVSGISTHIRAFIITYMANSSF